MLVSARVDFEMSSNTLRLGPHHTWPSFTILKKWRDFLQILKHIAFSTLSASLVSSSCLQVPVKAISGNSRISMSPFLYLNTHTGSIHLCKIGMTFKQNFTLRF